MSAQFDALACAVFDWRDYIDKLPCLDEVPEEQQRDLIATYLQEHTDWLPDVWSHVADSEADTVAAMIVGTVDGDRRCEFDDSLFIAARLALQDAVNDRIELLYERYVYEYGVYSLADKNGPAELIGWRCPDERF